MNELSRRNRGVSLVELIIVLNIIAIIVAIIVPVYRSAKGRAAVSGCTANLRAVWTQIQKYGQREGDLPDYLGQLYPDYVQNSDTLRCPVDRRRELSPQAVGYGLDLLYVKRDRNEPGTAILGGCPYHRKGLILHLDGSITQGEFQSANLTAASGAEVMARDSVVFEPATTNTDLQTGDTVRTGNGGAASIRFEEGSTVSLRDNSELTLKILMRAEQPGKLVRVLTQYIGTVIADVVDGPYVGGGGVFEIQTPSAIAAVRGTRFRVDVDAQGNTTVTVMRGIVEVRGNGKTKKVRPTQTVKIMKVKHSDDAKKSQPQVTKGHAAGGQGGGAGNGGGKGNGNGSNGNGG